MDLSDEDKERMLKERKLDIARKFIDGIEFPKVKGQTRIRQSVVFTEAELRMQRTLKLISNPNHQTLYSLDLERKLMTETSLNTLISDLHGVVKRNSHAKVLITFLRTALKKSLFGCEVNVALCSDASATQLDFVESSNTYGRKVQRGQSICFECLDQKDVVLQVVTKSKDEDKANLPHITSGEAVVYVPLLGKGGGVGIVEIHGLYSEGVVDRGRYERNPNALRSMIHAKDFRFKDSVKLWRTPSSRSGGVVVNEIKIEGITMYHVVSGIITNIAFEKNGVPYVGGARYTLVWEDGLVEESISANELLKVYQRTPQSLGCGTVLDEHLIENLLKVGLAAGELLEVQRTRDVVSSFRKQLFIPDLQDTDVCEITLDAVGTVITGIRMSHLLAFNPTTNEGVSLMTKFPSARTIDRAMQTSYTEVVRRCMHNPNPREPTIINDSISLEWVVIEIAVPVGYCWPREPQLTRFFAAVVRYKNPQAAAAAAEVVYFCEMVVTLSEALGVLFAKQLRGRHRKDLIKSIEEQLYEWRHLPVHQVCHNALQVASEILPPPTCAYVGIIQQGGNEIQFIASNQSSDMVGKTLRRGEGVSFEVMESMQAIVLRADDVDKRKILVPGAAVDSMYGKMYYRAKIIAVRGHDLYDVLYDEDQVTETAVSIDRIRPVHSAFRTKKFGSFELPFVSIPLRYRTKGVGVLNLDNFLNVPHASYDPQPEEGLINFLDKLGRILGTTLDTQSKKTSLKSLATVCRSSASTLGEILDTLFEVITTNIYYVQSICAVQVPTELFSSKSEKKSKKKLKMASAARVNFLQIQGLPTPEVKAALNAYDPVKFHLKPVHKKGDNCVWLVCKLRAAEKGAIGKIFLVSIHQRLPFNDPDVEFLQIAQKILVEGLQGLDVRKARGEIRFEALREIKQICLKWNTMDRHALFAEVMEQVEFCFFTANMYVGKLGLQNKEIRYFLASRLSNMKGQVLKRIMSNGISFTALDELKRIFVQQKSALAHNLHHFGPREQFEYPFVAIPIVAHIDSVIAVLGVDACDDPISESERHENITSFFGTVGSQLSAPIRGYCADDARAELERIGATAKTFREGMKEIKKVVLTLLPYAVRVAEVSYLPREMKSFRGEVAAVTLDEYIIHVRVLDLQSLSKTPIALFECYWNGVNVFHTKFKSDIDVLPFTLHVAKGVQLSHVSLNCVLKSSIGKEIARKSLSFHYFVNTPVYAIDHIFDNASHASSDVHIAKATIVSKMLRADDFVSFSMSHISCVELSLLDGGLPPDPMARVYWNGAEVGRTDAASKTISPNWLDLKIDFHLDSKVAGTGLLAVELWDEDALGRSHFFGRFELSEAKLIDLAIAAAKGRAHVTMHAKGVESDKGRRPTHRRTVVIQDPKHRASSSSKPLSSPLKSSLPATLESTAEGADEDDSHGHLKHEQFDGVEVTWAPLGKHQTLAPYMQNSVGGHISLKGVMKKASDMKMADILEVLNVKIVEKLTIMESDSVVNAVNTEFTSCEIRILAARSLLLKETYSSIPEAVVNPFVVIIFNGEEIGRTGTQLHTADPTWEDEVFTIRVPNKETGTNMLGIEIHNLGEHGKGSLIGRSLITGSQLISLVAGVHPRAWWFDLHPRDGTTLEQAFFRGQIKIAGHPVKADLVVLDLEAPIAYKFEISLLQGKNILINERLSRYLMTIQFNGILIHKSQSYSETGDVVWGNERVVFWQSGDKSLEESHMLIEFWPLDKSGGRLDKRLAVIHVNGQTLKKLFGQSGCVTTWLPITFSADSRSAKGAVLGECQVRTGPEDAANKVLEDGKEIFINILAASMLVSRNAHTRNSQTLVKANPYCTVKWNGKLVGKTAIVENSVDPIWTKQLFCFRLPRERPEEDAISNCTLRIDVFDRNLDGPASTDTSLGCLLLTGKSLSDMVASGSVKTKWMSLVKENISAYQERIDRASAISQRAIYGEIKIRGGAIGDPKDKDTSDHFREFRLDILSAMGLGQSDAFKKSSPYVTIEWEKMERGRTKILFETNTPEYAAESFLMRVSPDRELVDQTLTVSIWSYKEKFADDFLGCVSFTGKELISFFSHGPSEVQEFTLGPSVELTEDENVLAQGMIFLRGSAATTEDSDSRVCQDAMINIVSASDLSRCNLFGSSADVYGIIYRSSRIEDAGAEYELFRTQVVPDSLNPVFSDEFMIVPVPVDDDWDEVTIRIELKDIGGDFLGCVILTGQQLKSLLGRTGSDCILPKSYDLIESPFMLHAKQVLVGGRLTLAGGLRDDMEEELAKVAKKRAEQGNMRNTYSTKGFDESGLGAKIQIHGAKKLGKADALAGKSNPYCKVKWNRRALTNSETIHSTLNPKWDSAVYDVKLPTGNNLERCLLEIEVWHADSLGGDQHDFLGMVTLRGQQLSTIFAGQGKKEVEFPLRENPALNTKQNRLVGQGTISLSGVAEEVAMDETVKVVDKAQSESIKFELNIMAATDLALPNLFSRPPDSFVSIYWRDETTPVAKTGLVAGNANPTFGETFVLEKPVGVSLAGSSLKVVLYNKKQMKANDFLGQLSFTGDALVALVTQSDGRLTSFELQRDPLLTEKQQTFVQGSITIGARVVRDETEVEEKVIPPGMKEMEVTVLAGSNLPKANFVGLSDPYCIIRWGSVEIGRTSTIMETLDPVWEGDENFTFLAPVSLGQKEKKGRNTLLNLSGSASARLTLLDSTKGKEEEMKLIIDCYDWNRVNAEIFLGCIELSGDQLHDLAAGNRMKRRWYDLTTTTRIPASDQKLVKAGQSKIEIMLGPHQEAQDGQDIEFHICEAVGLAKVDTFGFADPYVKVRFNHRLIGKTEVIKRTLTPVWDNEIFNVRLPQNVDYVDSVLYLEIWDWNLTAKGTFLGSVTVAGHQLQHLVEKTHMALTWFDLTPSEYLPESIQGFVQGRLAIKAGIQGDHNLVSTAKLLKYELNILSATGLARSDGIFGVSDPFAIAKWNSKEFGRTPYVAKTINPIWEDQTFYFFVDPSQMEVANELCVELWSQTLISKSEFLGCVILSGAALADVLAAEGEVKLTSDLKPSPRRTDKKQATIQGSLAISIKRLIFDEDLSVNGPNIQLKWGEERDVDAGNPSLELSILKADELMVTKTVLNTSDPYCVIFWDKKEVGMTAVKKGVSPEWSDETFSMKLESSMETDNGSLVIEIWDSETLRKGTFLGRIQLSFWTLIRLSEGIFTFALESTDRSQVIRGTITISLRIQFPFWDSIVPHVPLISRRKIKILSGNEFPKISGDLPSTKCVITYQGAIKAKTIVSEREANPMWPIAQCEILVDANVAVDVQVEVFHVDSVEQKEICIGEVTIPYEYLIRPPNEAFDVFLGPPAKLPAKKYKFAVSGSVNVQVVNTQELRADEHQSFSSATTRHLSSFELEDLLATRSSNVGDEYLIDGAKLTEEQILWLGTAFDLTSAQTLNNQKEWIVLPLRDLGIRTGSKYSDFHGTIPGHRYAICIQRPPERINISDAYLLGDVEVALQSCVSQLRRKQVFQEIRNTVMAKYKSAISDIVKLESFDVDMVKKWLVKALFTCFPGSITYLTKISSDQNNLFISVYEDGTATPTREVVVISGQGFDWELVGRHPPKSIVLRSAVDLRHRRLLSIKPFPNTRLPKMYIPFLAGDVASAFFAVENLDVYRGGLNVPFNDEVEVRGWLEELGGLFGDAMYVGKEKFAIRSLESYAQLWNSTVNGLMEQVLQHSLQVLQACKLIEIWSTNQDFAMKSLLTKAAESPKRSGRLLNISEILIKFVPKASIRDMISRKVVIVGPNDIDEDDDEQKEEEAAQTIEITQNRQWICGVRYDGIEQSGFVKALDSKPVAPASPPKAGQPGGGSPATPQSPPISAFQMRNVKVVITNDRNIVVSLYEVDKNLNIINEFSGRVSFSTLQESKLTLTMQPVRKASIEGSFDVELFLFWPKPEGVSKAVNVASLSRKVRSVTLHIKRATGLIEIAGARTKPNAYCEVYWGKKLIGKTPVKKDTCNPEWNQTFTVQYKREPTPFIIEVYDFSMMGKGVFFGRLELPFEQLLAPTVAETDFPLLHKIGMNAAKQKFIGGLLTVEHEVEMYDVEEEVVAAKPVGGSSAVIAGAGTKPQGILPRAIFSMENPALYITICCASDLAKANMFGGGSDPFVVVYSSTSKDPLFKTQVIENNLDPIWNETFALNFGLSLKMDSTTIRDFPDVTLEVWDYNRIGRGSFLGSCTLTPYKYFQNKSGDFLLTKSPKFSEKENKLAQGTLSLRFKIADNVSTLGTGKYLFGMYRSLTTIVYLEVYILRCRDLMATNRYSGKSSPFVRLLWNDIVHETSYVKNNVNPSWNHEKFCLNITAAGSNIGELVLQVWDKNFFSQGQFLGEVRIGIDQVLHPKNSNQELFLKSLPGEEPGKITGSIVFRLMQKVQHQQVALKPTDYEEDKILVSHMDPIPIYVIKDPEEERKRQMYEKTKFPGIISKAKEQTEKYLSKPFERLGLISETHSGQLMAACQRSEHTVLKTDLADMCCVPTEFSGTNNLEALMIFARYDTGRLPRRDIQYLRRARDVLSAGLHMNTKRQDRAELRAATHTKLVALHEHVKDSPEEFVLDSIPIIESGLACSISVYLLGPDGKSIFHCDHITGKLDPTAAVNEFIVKAAKVCRHDLILQFYRDTHSVFDLKWDSLSQMCAVPLKMAAEEIELVEEKGICEDLMQLGSLVEPDGCYVVPLLANNQIFTGVIVIHEANKIPHALYRIKNKMAAVTDDETALQKKKKKGGAKKDDKVEPNKPKAIEFPGPEQGVTDLLREMGALVGAGVASCRMACSLNHMTEFHVTPETPLMDIIRFWFRQIALAVPTIRELTIWGVDIRRDSLNSLFPNRLNANSSSAVDKRPKGPLGFLLSLFSRNVTKLQVAADVVTAFEASEKSRGPPVAAGYFASEDPTDMLSTPMERKKFESIKGTEKEDRYRRNAIQAVRIHKHIVQHAIDQVETMKKAWTISTPSVFLRTTSPSESMEAGGGQGVGGKGAGSIEASEAESASLAPSIDNSSVTNGTLMTTQYNVNHDKKVVDPPAPTADNAYMELVQTEAKRCSDDLKLNSFRVCTGHFLTSIANTPGSKAALDDVFDPDYSKRKMDFERDRQLLVLKKLEREGLRRQKLRDKWKEKLLLARKAADNSQDDDHLSDISDEIDEEEISREMEDLDSDDDADEDISAIGSKSFVSPHAFSGKWKPTPEEIASANLKNRSASISPGVGNFKRGASQSIGRPTSPRSLPGTSSSTKISLAGPLISQRGRTPFQAPLPSKPPPLPEGPPPQSPLRAPSSTGMSPSLKGKQTSFDLPDSVGALKEKSPSKLFATDSSEPSRKTFASSKSRKSVLFSDVATDQPGEQSSLQDGSSLESLDNETLDDQTIAKDDPAHRGLPWKYYIAISNHGFGGETGWAVSDTLTAKFLEEMSVLLDRALQHFVILRHDIAQREAADDVKAALSRQVVREKKRQAKAAKAAKAMSLKTGVPEPASDSSGSDEEHNPEKKHRHSHHQHGHHHHHHRHHKSISVPSAAATPTADGPSEGGAATGLASASSSISSTHKSESSVHRTEPSSVRRSEESSVRRSEGSSVHRSEHKTDGSVRKHRKAEIVQRLDSVDSSVHHSVVSRDSETQQQTKPSEISK